jgi:hypothetical protein
VKNATFAAIVKQCVGVKRLVAKGSSHSKQQQRKGEKRSRIEQIKRQKKKRREQPPFMLKEFAQKDREKEST